MTRYREALPQLAGDKLFLTDGGLETDLIFHHGVDLPLFAAIKFFREGANTDLVRRYYAPYIQTAQDHGAGFILEGGTWRASPDWLEKLGYEADEFEVVNNRAVAFLKSLRDEYETPACPMVISATIGPRGDGYAIDAKMTAEEAQVYHSWQANLFAKNEADMMTAMTMNYVEEAIGVARAAKAANMPVVISFTVELDGRLPSGQALGEAIEQVGAATGDYPSYFMINCAHPDHFTTTLEAGGSWVKRIKSLRANASRCSHAELDEATELDDGNPVEFGALHAALRKAFPNLTVLGGCCGTDHRHVEEIAKACAC